MKKTRKYGPIVASMDWEQMRLSVMHPDGFRNFEGAFEIVPQSTAISYKSHLCKDLVFKLNENWWHLKMPDWLKCHCQLKTNNSNLKIDNSIPKITGCAVNEISFYFTASDNDCLESSPIRYSYKVDVCSHMSCVSSEKIQEIRKTHMPFTIIRIAGKSFLCPDSFGVEKSEDNAVHLCRDCANCSAKPKSEGGCLKVLHRKKTIEHYPFILEARASCGPDGDSILISKCADFIKDNREVTPTSTIQPEFPLSRTLF